MNNDRRVTLLTKTYDWLLRKRLIREPQWGQPGVLYRLLRIRMFSAVVLALPAFVLCLWYSMAAIASHFVQERLSRVHEPLTVKVFQLHLHDRLVRDWRRLSMPEPQRKSTLPTYGLAISAASLDELDRHPPVDDGPSYYVDASVVRNNQVRDVQVRYRGSGAQPHNPQQSWKVRTKGVKTVEGFEAFNLINTPEAVPFEEDIILEIAREQGLLAPEYFPFRFLLNKNYMGVYFFEAQPDDGLLRRERRAPGSIYSGGESPIDPQTGVNTLFRSADHFSKAAQGVHQELGERVELERLVDAINRATPRAFAEYAEAHLDTEKFARFDALDVTFGCSRHDFSDNHKFYYDPYRDRFEPIAWNFRGCKHEREFDRTENPLLLRLKTLPGFVTQRNQFVNELLRGAGSPESLRQRMRRFLDGLQEDQLRDPFWDAHQLLPAVSPYYSQLMRPLSRSLQDTLVETRLFELQQRNIFLSSALAAWDLNVGLFSAPPQAASRGRSTELPRLTVVDVNVGGESGYGITRLEPAWANACKPRAWHAYADTTLDGEFDRERDQRLADVENNAANAEVDLKLYPGVRFLPRPVHPRRGRIRAMPETRSYRLYIESDSCDAGSLALDAVNLATGKTRRLVAQPVSTAVRQAPSRAACGDAYAEAPGYTSPHPWCFPGPTPELVRIGPGTVEIHETKVFGPTQSVVIAPGTVLRMGNRASLIFNGRVQALGTPEAPIRFEPILETWGGLVIHGPRTQGSHLNHVTLVHGTHAASGSLLTPGTLNVQDTKSVTLENCQVLDSSQSAVGIHVADVSDLHLDHSRIRALAGDGIVIRHSTAKATRLDVANVGRDGIVVDGSDVEISGARVIAAKRNALDAGQGTRMSLHDSLLARSTTGLNARESASIEHTGVLVYGDKTGVYLDTADDRFPGKSKLKGDALHVVGCETPLVAETKGKKQQNQVVERLTSAALEGLRTRVLTIASWDDLDAALAQAVEGAKR